MQDSNSSNVQRQSTEEPVLYFRPLLQLDNSSSWPPIEHPDLLDLDRPPGSDSLPPVQLPRNMHIDAIPYSDDDPPTKHEGRILSPTPSPPFPPAHPSSNALSLTPPSAHGHTRSPVLTRPPTMLENFSRTVRNYVPTSIPVPTSAPSPPRISRPVSFGSFMGTNIGHQHPDSTERDVLAGTPPGRRRTRPPTSQSSPMAGLDPMDPPEVQVTILRPKDGDATPGPFSAYPTVAEGDAVQWSRWDSLLLPNSKPRRVLFLGYSSGFQIWDCTNLASVSEMLNLCGPLWGHVTFAGVLPQASIDDGQLTGQRPLIGVVSKTRGQSIMVIYSLRSHTVVKRLPFNNVTSFASSSLFTIISTANPPSLHVLSSASLTILHSIPSSSIFAYSRTSTIKPNSNNTVLLSGIDTHDLDDVSTSNNPVPVYSLSHRLLAFAAHPPRQDSPHRHTTLQPRTHTRTSSTPFGITQADLGNAAVKVGGTVLSGMKSLGGMAFNAAAEYAKSRSGISPHTPSSPRVNEEPTVRLPSAKGDQPSAASVISGVSNLFFSRSAPAGSGNHEHDPAYSRANLRGVTSGGHATPASDAEDSGDAWLSNTSASGSYVKVLDLAPLLNSRAAAHPQVITEFVAAKHQPISHLKFTHDGNSLLVAPKDGQVVRIFQIRRSLHVLRGGMSGSLEGNPPSGSKGTSSDVGLVPNWSPPSPSLEEDVPWHVYSLRRGRTSAVIESIEVSPDGRWVAVGTGKGTVHVFAINPYGGQPDLRSHMDAKIWNVDKPQPLSTELTPIARLRSIKLTGADGLFCDLSFTFVSSTETSLPSSLLPPQMASSPSTSSGRSDIPSPQFSHRQQNFKDVLLFDSASGTLSLRRITIEQRPREYGIPFSAPIASLATSISLPGVGPAGRLSASPPSHPPKESRKSSGLTQQLLDSATEVVGKENTVATWQLKRRHDWVEVKRVVSDMGDSPKVPLSSSLAQAELSTCSRAPGIVSRSIYLSHQFLFYTLGEDYHALIRQHRLAISGAKIDVRKEVEASAYAYSGVPPAQFVEDLSFSPDHHHLHSHSYSYSHPHPHHHHLSHGASSLDEPLANAMSVELAYDVSGRRVPIPMLPNGVGGGTGSGSRSMGMGGGIGIPIRVTAGIGEGIEGIGRMIRREMGRVRGSGSPGGGGRVGGGRVGGGRVGGGRVGGGRVGGERRVPLEFDEQDEDFGRVEGGGVASAGEDGDGNASHGHGGVDGNDDDDDEEDLWRAWSEEDRLAVDEAEQFDDVLGVMDEDQARGLAQGNRTGGRW